MAGADRVDVVPLHQEQVPADLLLRYGASGFAAVIMAVHALENHADAVDPDHAVPDLNFPETDLLEGRLLRAVRSGKDNLQAVQVRILRGPEARPADLQLSGRFLQAGNRPFALREDLLPLLQADGEAGALRRFRLHPPVQQALREGIIRLRRDLQVPHVRRGDGIKIHVPENAGKAQEILVLQPAAGTPAVYPAGQFVFPFPQGFRQFELMRGKAVRGKADIGPVQPQGHAALHALEGDKQAFPLHLLRQAEIFHIAGDRIKDLRQVARPQVPLPVPGILRVAVLRRAVSLQLDMRRHTDLLPAAAVVFRLFKTGDDLGGIHRVGKLPQAVQGQAVRRRDRVVRMRIQPVLAEKAGILQSALIKHAMHAPFRIICFPLSGPFSSVRRPARPHREPAAPAGKARRNAGSCPYP